MAPPKIARKCITLEQNSRVREVAKDGGAKSNIAKEFDIPASAFCVISRNKQDIWIVLKGTFPANKSVFASQSIWRWRLHFSNGRRARGPPAYLSMDLRYWRCSLVSQTSDAATDGYKDPTSAVVPHLLCWACKELVTEKIANCFAHAGSSRGHVHDEQEHDGPDIEDCDDFYR